MCSKYASNCLPSSIPRFSSGWETSASSYQSYFREFKVFKGSFAVISAPKRRHVFPCSSSCRKPPKCKLATAEAWEKLRTCNSNHFRIARDVRFCVEMMSRWKRTKFLLLLLEYETNDYTRCSLEGIKWNGIKYEGTNEHTTDLPTDWPNQRREEPTKRQFPDLLDQSSKMVDPVIPILKFNRGLLRKF